MNDDSIYLQVYVTDIVWDCSDEEKEQNQLPDSDFFVIEIEEDTSDDEISEILSDRLSDTYGFCHHGFCWEEVDPDDEKE